MDEAVAPDGKIENPDPGIGPLRKPTGGGFDTTMLSNLGLVESVEWGEDAVLEIVHLRRTAVAPATEIVELLLALALERRQRRVEKSGSGRSASIAADNPLTCGDEKMCRLKFGDAFEKVGRRRMRRLQVLAYRFHAPALRASPPIDPADTDPCAGAC